MENGVGEPTVNGRHRFLRRAARRRSQLPVRVRDITVTDEHEVKRAVHAAMLGNAMEWFDFGIYAYLAVTIGEVFYPSGSETAQTLSSLATFAAAFLVRPIGGLVLGPLGDRIGRKSILALTMIMMAGATCAIGLLPSHAAIGFWAPVLLVLLRMVQGFSTGGEYGGAATFIAEYAPDRRRGYWASFLELGTLAGYTAAASLVTLLYTLLSDDAMISWGWRIPFLVAAPIGLVGLYLRVKLEDTPAFRQQQHDAGETGKATRPPEAKSLKTMFTGQWRAMVLCVALVAAYNVNDYMLLSYMPTYLESTIDISGTAGLMAIVVVMVISILLINRVGRLSDRVGRKPILMTGSIGFLVLALPSFLLIRTGHWVAIFVGLLALGLMLLCYLGVMSASLPALFPTELRYGSLAIAFNVGVSVFGGTTPLAVEALVSVTGSNLMPAVYMMCAACIGIVAVAVMKETSRKPLDGSAPAVATREEAEEIAEERRAEDTAAIRADVAVPS